jgi:hypothetical protein
MFGILASSFLSIVVTVVVRFIRIIMGLRGGSHFISAKLFVTDTPCK